MNLESIKRRHHTSLYEESTMYFNRFDICDAYYLFFSHYHWGQGSSFYSRLSGMLDYYKPSPLLSYENLSENAQMIYDNLVDTKGEAYVL
jgi:hypothetical protein